MMMPGRNGESTSSEYRYGFQGQEKDDEVKGAGNSINYTFRMHDPRLGRFFAVDPLHSEYPHNSPYAFSENRVIASVEIEGLEAHDLSDGSYIDMGTEADLEGLPNNSYSQWEDLFEHENSSEYFTSLHWAQQFNVGEGIQKQCMADATSDNVNTDYYAAKISRLPQGFSPDELFNHIRINLNDFTKGVSEFSAHDEANKIRWESKTGDYKYSVMHFDAWLWGSVSKV